MNGTADQQLLDAIRRRGGMTIHQCVEFSAVTSTAVRLRLNRLMAQGLIDRVSQHESRRAGRPQYSYVLTEQAHLMMGQNYADLAKTLWAELKSFEDRALGMKVLRRVADRLAEYYRRQMPGKNVAERLGALKRLLADRGVDAEVDSSGLLPVLRQHSCPYHELAEADRTVCGIEMRMFEKALDADLKLSQCRLDGHRCCEFEVREPEIAAQPSASV